VEWSSATDVLIKHPQREDPYDDARRWCRCSCNGSDWQASRTPSVRLALGIVHWN